MTNDKIEEMIDVAVYSLVQELEETADCQDSDGLFRQDAYDVIDAHFTTFADEIRKEAYEAGVKAEREREKAGQSKLDQKVIDAYENYMWNVDEAVKFVGIGAGSRMAGNINLIQTLIAQHKKDCFDTIEEVIFNPKEV